MKKYNFYLADDLLFTGRLSKIENIDSVFPRMLGRKNRIHLKDKILDYFNFSKYGTCKFCNALYIRNPSYKYDIKESGIFITGVELSKYQKSLTNNIELEKCHDNDKCSGNDLNRNSIEYVKIIYSMNEEEAKNFIHTRNSSPFYAVNHNSIEEYKEFQSKQLFKPNMTILEKNKIIELQNYHRSIEFYKIRYGSELGELKWKSIQKQKAITLENMMSKHGETDGIIKYKAWKDKIQITLENMISKYGVEEGIIKWTTYFNKLKENTRYGNIYMTEKYNILRSSYEKDFYDLLIENGLKENEDFYLEEYYNNNINMMRSDFYIKKINMHIEIAGMMRDDEYVQKMDIKKKLYDPVIIIPNKDNYNELILSIKEKLNDTRN